MVFDGQKNQLVGLSKISPYKRELFMIPLSMNRVSKIGLYKSPLYKRGLFMIPLSKTGICKSWLLESRVLMRLRLFKKVVKGVQ